MRYIVNKIHCKVYNGSELNISSLEYSFFQKHLVIVLQCIRLYSVIWRSLFLWHIIPKSPLRTVVSLTQNNRQLKKAWALSPTLWKCIRTMSVWSNSYTLSYPLATRYTNSPYLTVPQIRRRYRTNQSRT